MFAKRIQECYPEAYKVLSKHYHKSKANIPFFKWRIVQRFVKCNFGLLDLQSYDVEDADASMRLNFEHVFCVNRGECPYENIVCHPKFNSKLSAQEKKIGKKWYDGVARDEIARISFLSPETVNNHIRNIYNKLGVHSKAEFIGYAHQNGIFEHEHQD